MLLLGDGNVCLKVYCVISYVIEELMLCNEAKKRNGMVMEVNSGVVFHVIDAGVGDCILIHDLDENKKILIDSGPSKGIGKISVQRQLTELLKDDNIIDVAIVTHNDDDHIGGFKSLIESNVIVVKEFIYNDIVSIASILNGNSQKISYNQDINLSKLLSHREIRLSNVCVDTSDFTQNDIEVGRMRLSFISPDLSKIEKLSQWAGKEERRRPPTKVSDDETSEVDIFTELEKIKDNDPFEKDGSPTNGSSIAFILKFNNKMFLFLGDSHADIIVESLKQSNERYNFEFVKLSHHASSKNTSQELLNSFKCKNYIICSDGKNNHGHPSIKTVARIFNVVESPCLYFSSNSAEIRHFVESFSDSCILPKTNILSLHYEY